MMNSIIIFLTVMSSAVVSSQNMFRPIVEWKQLDFLFPSENERQTAMKEGRFIPENCIPVDMDVQYAINGNSRVFVSIPRFNEGVPITLGTVSQYMGPNGPLIEPYPDYSWHSSYGSDCDGITSLVRMTIDECNRLWVLDTGKIGFDWKCPAQILIFDLKTDQLLHKYRIPREQLTNASLMNTIVVDVLDSKLGCFNTKAYIADPTAYGMIVYDSLKDTSWRIENPLFNYTVGYETITIDGDSFNFTDGVFGLALKKSTSLLPSIFDNRQLYFHSMNSIYENSVPTSVLNDEKAFEKNLNAHSGYFKRLGSRGIQSAAQAMDSFGNLYFGMMEPIAIACWDSNLPYSSHKLRIVENNRETLQFASGVKVIKGIFGQESVWVSTNRFQRLRAGTIDWNDINFRIQAVPVSEILYSGGCRV